jgi:hypothetical protein
MLILSLICSTEGCRSRLDWDEELHFTHDRLQQGEAIVDALRNMAKQLRWQQRLNGDLCPECAGRKRVQYIVAGHDLRSVL